LKASKFSSLVFTSAQFMIHCSPIWRHRRNLSFTPYKASCQEFAVQHLRQH
jgi:putative heme iron utilization protein